LLEIQMFQTRSAKKAQLVTLSNADLTKVVGGLAPADSPWAQAVSQEPRDADSKGIVTGKRVYQLSSVSES
jgi:hypothetical protein